jgi:cyclic beta-1,2-glucan synthetase
VDGDAARSDLMSFNGLGGFTPDGREYVISTTPALTTPAPWVNVLANPHFGTVVSESGRAYTWSENAHEYRLTPWHNDPVSDSSGEALYLRDEESGHYWSPMPLPCRGSDRLCDSAWLRLQRVRALGRRHPFRDMGLCRDRRCRQVHGHQASQ